MSEIEKKKSRSFFFAYNVDQLLMNPMKCLTTSVSHFFSSFENLDLNKFLSMDKYEKIKKIGEGSYGKTKSFHFLDNFTSIT
jgi:hypothetical protein